jgi:hypothetical protein
VVEPLEGDFIEKCKDITDAENLQKLIGWNCHILVMNSIQKMMGIQGMSPKEAWDTKLGMTLTRAAAAYIPYFNIVSFR